MFHQEKDLRKRSNPMFDMKVRVSPDYQTMIHRRVVCLQSKLFESLLKREQELVGSEEIVQTLLLELPITDEKDERERKELIRSFEQCLDTMYDVPIVMSVSFIKVASFLLMDTEAILRTWARKLPKTLETSDKETIKQLVEIESIGYSNPVIKNVISYYGNEIIPELNIPHEILDEMMIFGVSKEVSEKFSKENQANRFLEKEEDNENMIILNRSELNHAGLISDSVQFKALGIDWSLDRFIVDFPEEMLKVYVHNDFDGKSCEIAPIKVRAHFVIFSKIKTSIETSSVQEIGQFNDFKAEFMRRKRIPNSLCTCFSLIKGEFKVSILLEQVE